MTPHPPKPRFALRVGITGHRPNKLPGHAIPRIDRQLREVFAAIDGAARTIHHDNSDVYDSAVPPGGAAGKPYSIRLISGFAEGADQMAVAACPARLDGRGDLAVSQGRVSARTSCSLPPATAATCGTSS